jgi:hypothetical protein
MGECGADLVGEQDGHLELLDRRADDAGRGGQGELTVNHGTLSDDEPDGAHR